MTILQQRETYLDADELRKLELNHTELSLLKKDNDIAILKTNRAILQKSLLSTEIILKSSEIDYLQDEKKLINEKYSNLEDKFKKFTGELESKYKLKSKWRFDPITGEVRDD